MKVKHKKTGRVYYWKDTMCNHDTIYAICYDDDGNIYSFPIQDVLVVKDESISDEKFLDDIDDFF